MFRNKKIRKVSLKIKKINHLSTVDLLLKNENLLDRFYL